jgi:YD repeat-containing protein
VSVPSRCRYPVARLTAFLLVSACLVGLSAQQPTTFRYFYDETNQLVKVVDSTGIVIEYVYDAVGNILQIKRTTLSSPGALAIFSVTPLQAGAGATITIQGQGFSTTPGNNVVTIGGLAAAVVSATATTLVVTVPTGETGGQISVTVNGVAASSGPNLVFVVTPPPVINSITPDGALAGKVIPFATVTGSNLSGAVFSFPSGATVSPKDVEDTTATLQITAMNTRGAFPLVATTSAGSSTSSVTPGNQFVVMISPDQAQSLVVSVLNTAAPASGTPDPTAVSNQANSFVVSVLNTAASASGTKDPTTVSNQADSLAISVLNTTSPASPGSDPANRTSEADSLIVSVLQSGSSVTPAGRTLREISSLVAGFTADGALDVIESGAAEGWVTGQVAIVGVRAPKTAHRVEFQVNGLPLTQSSQYPYLMSFNVPSGFRDLTLTVRDLGADGRVMASRDWRQPILADAGTVLSGRVVDNQGEPVAGASVAVEAGGLYGEFFGFREQLASMPTLSDRRPDVVGLVPALNWLNPEAVFGNDPMGLRLTPAFAARYSGALLVPQDGEYRFTVRSQNEAKVVLDGQEISGKPRISLRAGAHRIEVLYYSSGSAEELSLSWIGPDGVERPIPSESFRASDSRLRAVSGADGRFSISEVPAKTSQVRVLVQTPDGRKGASVWTPASNGGVTATGDIVVTKQERQ